MAGFSCVLFLFIISLYLVASSKDTTKRLVLEQDIETIVLSLQNEVNQLKSKVSLLELTRSGSTFVRWGKTSCPGNGTDLIYKGYLAGNQWNQNGGGSNHLCLPDDPTWAKYEDGLASGSTIHGTEIEGNAQVLTSLFGSNIDNQDLSCAVCKSSRIHNIMIPARSTCYAGWTLEYQGYIATAGETWAGSSEFICLDKDPDLVTHGAGNDDEHVIDVVEVQCGASGGLPCPPYVQGRELACVVCTQ